MNSNSCVSIDTIKTIADRGDKALIRWEFDELWTVPVTSRPSLNACYGRHHLTPTRLMVSTIVHKLGFAIPCYENFPAKSAFELYLAGTTWQVLPA